MAERVGVVAALWRYPVKSMRGETLEVARIGPRGIAGDRGLALVDDTTGHVASAKHPRRWGGLLAARAETTREGVTLVLPDGTRLPAGAPGTDAALSAWCGRPVRLLDTPPHEATLERVASDVESGRGQVAVRRLAAAAPDGTFFDYAPLHLVTTASLAAAAPGEAPPVDPRRTRANLVVSTARSRGFVEDAWSGRPLRVGEVVLRVGLPSPRCAVPGLAQGDALSADAGVLPAIAAAHRIPVADLGSYACLGIYADIEQAGVVRTGDPVVLV